MKSSALRAYEFGSHMLHATTTLCFIVFLFSNLIKRAEINANPQVVLFGHKSNNCYMRFKPNIDLTPLFDINTKQIFIYAVCKTGQQHEMFWSKIVERKTPKKLFDIVNNNYPFRINEGVDSFSEIQFELRANLFPYCGKMKDILLSEFNHSNKH